MAAILDLRKTTEDGFAMMYGHQKSQFDGINARFDRLDGLESKMDRRFDSVELRFDIFERRVSALEQHNPH